MKSPLAPRSLWTCALSVLASLPGTAFAQDPDAAPTWQPGNPVTSRVRDQVGTREPEPVTDGVYGRFEGDFDFGLGAGAESSEGDWRGALRFSLHYFSTAGIYVTYRDAFDSNAEVPRWTVARASHLMHHDKQNRTAAAELAALPELSTSWKEELLARSAK